MAERPRPGWLDRIRRWFDDALPAPPDIDAARAEQTLEDEGLTPADAEQRRAARVVTQEKEGKGSYR